MRCVRRVTRSVCLASRAWSSGMTMHARFCRGSCCISCLLLSQLAAQLANVRSRMTSQASTRRPPLASKLARFDACYQPAAGGGTQGTAVAEARCEVGRCTLKVVRDMRCVPSRGTVP